MSIQDIEQATLEYIKDIFNKEYIGKIIVKELDPIGYSVSLYPNGQYYPHVFDAELEDDRFLKYLKQELRGRRYHLQWYAELNLRDPVPCEPIQKSCSCNDKR